MNIDFYNPVSILSGKDCFKNFTNYRQFGERCMIVCGKNSARRSGALADAEKGLSEAGIAYLVFDKIEPNPLVSTAYEGGRAAREYGADFIVGIGGGSPLDAAKAIAAFAANPGLSQDQLFTAQRKKALPVLAVNTTAGTGSEVTPYSILTVPEIGNKRSLSGNDLYARIAFLDPAYTLSLPLSQTMSTAVDALCHAVEGYFMKKANPVSDALAEKCIPALCSGIRSALAGDLGYTVREELLYASTLAGIVISRTGTGFVHSTGYMLTYHNGVPHGNANAYFIADFVDFMGKTAPERAKRIYALCGVENAGGLYSLVSSCPEMKLNLKLDRETLSVYADKAAGAKNVSNAISSITRDELYGILEKRLG